MHKRISFAEPEKLSEIFDASHRQEWQNTSHILDTLNLSDDDTIADVGAGTGYFTALFSDRIRSGKIFAIDAEPNMVSYMNNHFANEQRNNIETGLCTLTDPCLPENLNIVFLANTYRFIENRSEFLKNLHNQVSDNTRVMFVDFKGSHARVSPETAMDEVTSAGFEIDHFDQDGCPDHYILTFRKIEA